MHLFILLLLAGPDAPVDPVIRAMRQCAASGRVLLLNESDSDRLSPPPSVPPGQPPVLTFRYMEGEKRHRFGDLDLVVDDAGH